MRKHGTVVLLGVVVAVAVGVAVMVAGCSLTSKREEEPLPPVTPAQRPAPTPIEVPLPPPPPPPPGPPATESEPVLGGAPSFTAPVEAPDSPAAFQYLEEAQMLQKQALELRSEERIAGIAAGVPGGVVGGVVGGMPMSPPARCIGPMNTEAYAHIRDNAFLAAATNPLSTFSIDVDTASYANVRRFLERGALPPKDAVRIEELINYFRYDYPEPEGALPFSVTTEVFACPWTTRHHLVSIGLQGRHIEDEQIPPRNLVFLLDVSGSMRYPRKLPLLKAAMKLLVEQLRSEDRVSIVVYAGSSGLVLPPTSGESKLRLRDALEQLEAGGSTAGGAGIQLAYDVAAKTFIKGGVNRVILATDGDFNVGITSQGDLVRLIEEKRETGVFLSVLGFGEGNLKDSTMERLADSGNGNYAYIDSLSEARKVLVRESGATLVTIAKDVKIQVEFNPARVTAYRLIGYENRMLEAEDFNDDAKDAGEIGAGHSVTALYEVIPAGVSISLPSVDPLRYQTPATAAPGSDSDELLMVKLRYKEPDGDASRLTSLAVADAIDETPSASARFVSAVAGFGMLLRDSEHKGEASWSDVADLARDARGADPEGYRSQFLQLVETASALVVPVRASSAE